MKPTLPICISAIPSPDASPELWRQVAPILSAIAEREQKRRLSSERAIATNALFVAQYLSYKRQWSNLWESLLSRNILHIGDVPTPQPPMPQPEIEVEVIAEPPPKPKKDRPTKPPKNKVAKPQQKREYNPLVFATLKSSLIRLCVFLWFADFLPYIAPLCPRRLQGWRRSDRTIALQTKPAKIPKQRKTTKGMRFEQVRIVTTEQLHQALTDTWLDTSAIAKRFRDIGINLTFPQTEDLLNNRANTDEIFKAPKGLHDAALYSRIQATEIECEYLSLSMAYELAQSRGYTCTKKTFGQSNDKILAKFGISYKPRKEMGALDNKLLNYSDVWCNRDA